ncbi:MAG: archaellin/type IV pilin N-terminal domain-containing protein [Candidatus Aenigmatarchaeota archaeon]
MKNKAISPLVAAVLLIAVTMTVAGMLAYWASSFVRERTKEWENQTLAGECQFADFRVYQCVYDNQNSRINLILENIRSIELKNIRLYVLYPNGTLTSEIPLNEPLRAGEVKVYHISNISPGFSKIIIKTHCPDISTESVC